MHLAKMCCISSGVGVSDKGLPSFDKALLDAGVGNYNLVRLSSILPNNIKWVDVKDITDYIREGSLLPIAYSTTSTSTVGETIVSTIGVGVSDEDHVNVIMEYSTKGVTEEEALATLDEMIKEAYEVRGWKLDDIIHTSVSAKCDKQGTKVTTFACIAEW